MGPSFDVAGRRRGGQCRCGGAAAANMPVNVPWPYGPGFDAIGHFAHCFYKPYNVTLDFTDMNVYIARGKAL
jgi:hypothetical protein